MEVKQKLIGGLNGRIQTLILEENHKAGLTQDSKECKHVIVFNNEKYAYTTRHFQRYNFFTAKTSIEIAEKICERLNRGDR